MIEIFSNKHINAFACKDSTRDSTTAFIEVSHNSQVTDKLYKTWYKMMAQRPRRMLTDWRYSTEMHSK